jgi:integrase
MILDAHLNSDARGAAMLGLHIVAKKRAGRPILWYVYAWRGGPQILAQIGGSKPQITKELVAAAKAAWDTQRKPNEETLMSVALEYQAAASTAWRPSTKADRYRMIGRFIEAFGDMPLAAAEDRRFRGDILRWRERWMAQPRTADKCTEIAQAILAHGVMVGRLAVNVASEIPRLYKANRSDLIWTDADFAALQRFASIEVMQAVRLAAYTGLRRSDLVSITWDAVADKSIIWKTQKRGVRVAIPMLQETRDLLASLPRSAPTILTNSRGQSWTPDGLETSFGKARNAAGLKLRLHDIRGTFVTQLARAGLTDNEIARIIGWSSQDVAVLRARYVDEARVIESLTARLQRKV